MLGCIGVRDSVDVARAGCLLSLIVVLVALILDAVFICVDKACVAGVAAGFQGALIVTSLMALGAGASVDEGETELNGGGFACIVLLFLVAIVGMVLSIIGSVMSCGKQA